MEKIIECNSNNKEMSEEEKRKKRRLGFHKLFANQRSSNKKAKTLTFEEGTVKMIQLRPGPFAGAAEFKKLGKPTDEKYQKYISMSEDGVKLNLPTEDEMKEIDSIVKKMEELRTMSPQPEDYYPQQRLLQEQRISIEPEIIRMRNDFADAAKAFHAASYCQSVCKANDELDEGEEWDDVIKAIVCLGVPDTLKELRKKDKEKRMLRDEEDKRKRQEERSSGTSERTSTTDNDREGTEVDREEPDNSVTIRDSNGNFVPVHSLLQGGERSERDRSMQRKKKTKKSNTISRNGLICVEGYEMTASFFDSWKKKSWLYTSKDKSGTNTTRCGDTKIGHGLALVNGRLHCSLCDTRVSKKFGQHLGGKTHWDLYESKKKKAVTADVRNGEAVKDAYERLTNDAIEELEKERVEKNLAGTSLSTAKIKYRVSVLEHACLANMSMGQLERFQPALNLKGSPALDIGCAHDLPRTIGKALRKAQEKKMKWVMENCYATYSTTSDGSPLGANAEAIIVRMIRTSDHKVVELLLSLKLFKSSLTGENIASNLLAELRRFELDPDNWRASMMDRAAANQKGMREIQRVSFYDPKFFPCLSHTFSAPGKEFKESCKELHVFRKAYNTSIMFRGKLYIEVKRLFGVTPIVAGGVRWYLEWEQIDQMDKFGFKRFVDEVIPFGMAGNLSKASVAKMKKASTPLVLPKVLVQAAAIAEVGRPFCIATYMTEGDDPLTFTVYMVFEELDAYVSRGPVFGEQSRTRRRCKEAAKLVHSLREECLENVVLAQHVVDSNLEEIEDFNRQIDSVSRDLELLQRSAQERENGVGRRRGQGVVNYRAMANPEGRPAADPQRMQQRIEQVTSLKDAKRDELEDSEEILSSVKEELRTLDEKLGPITEDDFVEYCKSVTQGAFLKYLKLFDEDRELIRVRKAFRACQVFDILYLHTDPSTETLGRMLDELINFGFPEFDEAFIAGMKNELNQLLDLTKHLPFDFEREPEESQLYTNRVLSRSRRARKRALMEAIERNLQRNENNGEDNELPQNIDAAIRAAGEDIGEIGQDDFRKMDWKNDPGERGRRIYEWWRVVMNEKKGHLPFFTKAVRTVCLVQPSSASAERVFSQLTFIRRAVGDRILGDLLELRAYIRCNNGLQDDYTA